MNAMKLVGACSVASALMLVAPLGEPRRIGDGNTAIGGSALLNTTNGIYNTAIGYNALAGTNVTQVNDNTAVGASPAEI